MKELEEWYNKNLKEDEGVIISTGDQNVMTPYSIPTAGEEDKMRVVIKATEVPDDKEEEEKDEEKKDETNALIGLMIYGEIEIMEDHIKEMSKLKDPYGIDKTRKDQLILLLEKNHKDLGDLIEKLK
jgi:hypothetical protein